MELAQKLVEDAAINKYIPQWNAVILFTFQMLETWLSFIQPWRYTDPSKQYSRERGEHDRTVDDKW